jgi:DNA uptake protein ComE-like DNA-binding protein
MVFFRHPRRLENADMRHVLSALIAATVTLVACGGAASPAASNATPNATASSAIATAAPSSAATATTAASTTKASANNATAAQLQAAFEAGGVPNASRWGIEVQE